MSTAKDSKRPAPRAKSSNYSRIADGLREQIVHGKYAPGSQLPSTGELATLWKSSYFTIHTALQVLVKEGWIQRVRGAGTYVAENKNRFVCAGIYHGSDIVSDEQAAYSRRLHVSLLEQFHKLGKETQIFIDSRPMNQQGTILPALAEAIARRHIQCLAAPTLNATNAAALSRLSVPVAFTTHTLSSKRTEFDIEGMFRESVRRLAVQGCRSVAVLSHVVEGKDPHDFSGLFYQYFRRALRREGLAVKDQWMRRPSQGTVALEQFGYTEFKSLWKCHNKPDGLIVYPDTVVRGVITAILEIGIKVVPLTMKFVFHRNAHADFICPFPVTWAISDEDLMAEGLVHSIMKQFNGEKATLTLLPYVFKKD